MNSKEKHSTKVITRINSSAILQIKGDNFLKIYQIISHLHNFVTIAPQAQPDFLTDKKFRLNFSKGASKELFLKISAKSNRGFREDLLIIYSCPYSASSPHFPEPCLLTDQNFMKNF